MRVFNVRRGRMRQMDHPSPLYGSVPVDGPGHLPALGRHARYLL
jgi:hypothetical protein